MGADAENHQIGRDLCRGLVTIRIAVSVGRPAAHRPSPPLGRRDLCRLWLWSREPRRAALPETLTRSWWWDLDETTRVQVRRLVQSVRLLEWLAWWLDATDEDPESAPREGGDERREVVGLGGDGAAGRVRITFW